jgi:hypothetical protein
MPTPTRLLNAFNATEAGIIMTSVVGCMLISGYWVLKPMGLPFPNTPLFTVMWVSAATVMRHGDGKQALRRNWWKRTLVLLGSLILGTTLAASIFSWMVNAPDFLRFMCSAVPGLAICGAVPLLSTEWPSTHRSDASTRVVWVRITAFLLAGTLVSLALYAFDLLLGH